MKRTKIDWTEVVWNPITGCTGPDGDGEHCWYCYAKRQAPRFAGRFGYPAEDPFRPTFHPNRLSEPAAEKTPRTVFVGSMGDTFGPAVEPDWIAQVGGAMAAAPQHRYLLLTRHPRRYTLLPPPQPDVEVWYGTTLTDHTLENDHRLDDLLEFGHAAQMDGHAIHLWVSIEPLLGSMSPHVLARLAEVHWVVIGALSGGGFPRGCHFDYFQMRDFVTAIIDSTSAPAFLKRSMHKALQFGVIRQDTPWSGPDNHVVLDTGGGR